MMNNVELSALIQEICELTRLLACVQEVYDNCHSIDRPLKHTNYLSHFTQMKIKPDEQTLYPDLTEMLFNFWLSRLEEIRTRIEECEKKLLNAGIHIKAEWPLETWELIIKPRLIKRDEDEQSGEPVTD